MAEPEQLRLIPLPDGGEQWPEGRQFARLYCHDPETQVRVIRTLLGGMADMQWKHENNAVLGAKLFLEGFLRHYPEVLAPLAAKDHDPDLHADEDYVPEPRMLWLLKAAGLSPDRSED